MNSTFLRRVVEDTSRLAQQLSKHLESRTTNLQASKTLNDINGQQLESFGGRLEKEIETIEHIEAIGQKLNDDIEAERGRGPTTLAALLNALQMGFRSLAIEKRSSEVWQVLAAVRTEFGKYNQVVEKLGKQLGTATNAVDSLRTHRVMTRTLKTIEVAPGCILPLRRFWVLPRTNC